MVQRPPFVVEAAEDGQASREALGQLLYKQVKCALHSIQYYTEYLRSQNKQSREHLLALSMSKRSYVLFTRGGSAMGRSYPDQEDGAITTKGTELSLP